MSGRRTRHDNARLLCDEAHRFFSREGSGWRREFDYATSLVGSGGQAEKLLSEGLKDFPAQLPDGRICSRAVAAGKDIGRDCGETKSQFAERETVIEKVRICTSERATDSRQDHFICQLDRLRTCPENGPQTL